MQPVLDVVSQLVRAEGRSRPFIALGVVTSVHEKTGDSDYACTVELRDSSLVLPRVPIATGVIGAVALPAIGDVVTVAFIEGDYHHPIVIGRLYHRSVAVPTHAPGQAVISLPGGETADDKRLDLRITTPGDGTRSVALTLDGSVKVELVINDSSIRLQAQDALIELTQSGSSDGQVRIEVGQATATFSQGGDVSIETTGTLKLKGNKVEISGDTQVKIAGTTVQLN
ncbi:MAG: phage baseplate assembly protein V [Vicinamibacterales bacterium]